MSNSDEASRQALRPSTQQPTQHSEQFVRTSVGAEPLAADPAPSGVLSRERATPDAYSEMREKVARAMHASTWAQTPVLWAKAAQDLSLSQADAAIAAVIQSLIEMDLPDDVMVEAKCVPTVAGDWRANYHAEFRAILAALKPLLTKGGA